MTSFMTSARIAECFKISKFQNFSFVVELVDDGCDGYFVFMTIRVYFLALSNRGQIIKPRHNDGYSRTIDMNT